MPVHGLPASSRIRLNNSDRANSLCRAGEDMALVYMRARNDWKKNCEKPSKLQHCFPVLRVRFADLKVKGRWRCSHSCRRRFLIRATPPSRVSGRLRLRSRRCHAENFTGRLHTVDRFLDTGACCGRFLIKEKWRLSGDGLGTLHSQLCCSNVDFQLTSVLAIAQVSGAQL